MVCSVVFFFGSCSFVARRLATIMLCFCFGCVHSMLWIVLLCGWFCGVLCLGCFCRHGFGANCVVMLFGLCSSYVVGFAVVCFGVM